MLQQHCVDVSQSEFFLIDTHYTHVRFALLIPFFYYFMALILFTIFFCSSATSPSLRMPPPPPTPLLLALPQPLPLDLLVTHTGLRHLKKSPSSALLMNG
jgi:hypothetical protein